MKLKYVHVIHLVIHSSRAPQSCVHPLHKKQNSGWGK